MRNLILKPNKKRILLASRTNLALSYPPLLPWTSVQGLLMMPKTGVEEDEVVIMDHFAEFLKEVRGDSAMTKNLKPLSHQHNKRGGSEVVESMKKGGILTWPAKRILGKRSKQLRQP